MGSLVSGTIGTGKKGIHTLAVSLPTLLLGFVTIITFPVRSGRLSSFHLGFLSFSEPASWKSEGPWLEDGSGAGDDMEEKRGGRRGRAGNG